MGRQLSEMGAAYADELEAIEGALLQVCIIKGFRVSNACLLPLWHAAC